MKELEFKIGDKVLIKQFDEMDPSIENWSPDFNWWGCVGIVREVHGKTLDVMFSDEYGCDVMENVHILSVVSYKQYNRDKKLTELGI